MSDPFFGSFACVATASGGGGLGAYMAFLPPWLFLGMLGILLSLFIMLIVYVIGKLTDMQNIDSYLKMEVWEAFFSFVILATVFAGVKFICSVPPDIFLSHEALENLYGAGAVPADPNIFDVIKEYLLFVRSVHSDTMVLFGMSQLVTGLVDINWQASAGGIGIQLTPLAGFSQQMQTANNLIAIFMNLYVLHMVLLRVIAYSSHAFLNYLLPMGIFFRCLQPTRKFGGALIGLALGFNFVYPIMLLMNAKMLAEYGGFNSLMYELAKFSGIVGLITLISNLFSGTAMVVGLGAGTLGFIMDAASSSGSSVPITSVVQTILDKTLRGVNDPDSMSLGGFWGFVMIPLNMLVSILKIVGSLVLLDVVFQAVSFLIVVAAIKNITKLLGEEMDISLLTRMV